eukprot:scaffold203360_cov36-Tisochrysis_lutea.AAC.2
MQNQQLSSKGLRNPWCCHGWPLVTANSPPRKKRAFKYGHNANISIRIVIAPSDLCEACVSVVFGLRSTPSTLVHRCLCAARVVSHNAGAAHAHHLTSA